MGITGVFSYLFQRQTTNVSEPAAGYRPTGGPKGRNSHDHSLMQEKSSIYSRSFLDRSDYKLNHRSAQGRCIVPPGADVRLPLSSIFPPYQQNHPAAIWCCFFPSGGAPYPMTQISFITEHRGSWCGVGGETEIFRVNPDNRIYLRWMQTSA